MPINYKIERKNFELIGDQIGSIIALEFASQADTYDNEACKCVHIYRDRNVPIDNTDTSVLNISYSASEFDNKHQGSKTGMNTYFIDVFCQSTSTRDDRGDALANLKLQRLMGIIDDILENPIYKHLSLGAPLIAHTIVESLDVVNVRKDDADALSSVFGRVTFKVKANEVTGLLAGNALTQAVAQIKLGLTDKGYKYEFIQE